MGRDPAAGLGFEALIVSPVWNPTLAGQLLTRLGSGVRFSTVSVELYGPPETKDGPPTIALRYDLAEVTLESMKAVATGAASELPMLELELGPYQEFEQTWDGDSGSSEVFCYNPADPTSGC